MFFFSIVIMALLPFFSQALEHNVATTNSTKYSTWMASSIISRNQGIAPSGSSSLEKSLLLRSGVLQTALVRIIQQYPNGTSTPLFKTYLSDSIDSNTPYLLNATVDTQYPLDYLSLGNPLIYTVQQTTNTTSNETYNEVLDALRLSIDLRSRNQFQGLWYYTYSNWSYLDGMFSLAPFYAYCTSLFSSSPNATSTAVADDLLQLDLLWEKSRRNDTPPGLLVHGYDASKTAVWADAANGASPHVWGRSLGWYAAGIADTLELLPVNRSSDVWTGLRARFEVLMNGVVSAVDPTTGAWWQVMDQPGREGNYVESSSSALFIFALLKGARLGFLGRDDAKIGTNATNYVDAATRAYEYVVDNFVINNGNGTLGYNGTVSVCSLNSTATYEYYINQPLEYNSVLGAESFVLASLEYENLKADL